MIYKIFTDFISSFQDFVSHFSSAIKQYQFYIRNILFLYFPTILTFDLFICHKVINCKYKLFIWDLLKRFFLITFLFYFIKDFFFMKILYKNFIL